MGHDYIPPNCIHDQITANGCYRPGSAIRLSAIPSLEGVDQMLIPPDMLNGKNNELNLEVTCTNTNNAAELGGLVGGETPDINFRSLPNLRGLQ